MSNVFEFTDYRAYLKAALPTTGEGRGQRSKLAEALGCQNGFVSLVLTGASDFSLEHGPVIGKFLGHTDDEDDYFLMLLHSARAGSVQLKKYYQKKIHLMQSKRREIRERIQVKSTFSVEDQQVYYSSWHYQAVHMCLYSPELRTRAALSKRLQVSLPSLNPVLDFLVRAELAKESGGTFTVTPSRTHLPKDSPLVSQHHTNWRMRAIQSLDQRRSTDLHYSGVFSLSESAAEQVREIFLDSISRIEPVIRDAKDETVYTVALDWFALGIGPGA